MSTVNKWHVEALLGAGPDRPALAPVARRRQHHETTGDESLWKLLSTVAAVDVTLP